MGARTAASSYGQFRRCGGGGSLRRRGHGNASRRRGLPRPGHRPGRRRLGHDQWPHDQAGRRREARSLGHPVRPAWHRLPADTRRGGRHRRPTPDPNSMAARCPIADRTSTDHSGPVAAGTRPTRWCPCSLLHHLSKLAQWCRHPGRLDGTDQTAGWRGRPPVCGSAGLRRAVRRRAARAFLRLVCLLGPFAAHRAPRGAEAWRLRRGISHSPRNAVACHLRTFVNWRPWMHDAGYASVDRVS